MFKYNSFFKFILSLFKHKSLNNLLFVFICASFILRIRFDLNGHISKGIWRIILRSKGLLLVCSSICFFWSLERLLCGQRSSSLIWKSNRFPLCWHFSSTLGHNLNSLDLYRLVGMHIHDFLTKQHFHLLHHYHQIQHSSGLCQSSLASSPWWNVLHSVFL